METVELILTTAIDLFNKLGTAKVTTNLIAKQAGISPGNLYYYFKDKSHIIREIYELMIRDWETVYEQVEDQSLLQDALRSFIDANFELLWKYRFFYRETVALMNLDPILACRQIEVTTERFERQRGVLKKAAQEGILRFSNPERELDEVLTIGWIVANNYLVHLESLGKTVQKTDYKTGTELVLKILYPYSTETHLT